MEIAEEINIPYREVMSALDAIAEPVSIYEPVFTDSQDSMLIVDQIRNPEGGADYLDIVTLRESIKRLPEREQKVLLYRYYQGRTQTEIATALQMSQAQVSRLEKSAIMQLRSSF